MSTPPGPARPGAARARLARGRACAAAPRSRRRPLSHRRTAEGRTAREPPGPYARSEAPHKPHERDGGSPRATLSLPRRAQAPAESPDRAATSDLRAKIAASGRDFGGSWGGGVAGVSRVSRGAGRGEGLCGGREPPSPTPPEAPQAPGVGGPGWPPTSRASTRPVAPSGTCPSGSCIQRKLPPAEAAPSAPSATCPQRELPPAGSVPLKLAEPLPPPYHRVRPRRVTSGQGASSCLSSCPCS